MKYAVVNGAFQDAQPGLSGNCKCCNSHVVSKCGKVKIWHWAHKGKRMCDPWWENETEWHRAWKDQFPKEWQEIIHYAESGEKHIADVKVEQGYVIEFQHSFIKSEERQSREDFYKKMIWIIDGARRLRDKKKFIEVWQRSWMPIDDKTKLRRLDLYFDECTLLRDWVGSKVPVFFDFGDEMIWGILPKTIKEQVYGFRIDRKLLIESLLFDLNENRLEDILKHCANLIEIDERHLRSKTNEMEQSSFRRLSERDLLNIGRLNVRSNNYSRRNFRRF